MSRTLRSQEHFRREARIRELPEEEVKKIKSSTAITHLNDVILGLVKNSIDAHARTIYVTVDLKRGACIVEDDGDGILPVEFADDGGLGKAYYTSKFHLPEQFDGRRGLFLASLASMSLLTITSRHVSYGSTNTVLFHRSKLVARLIPAPANHELKSINHGTKVRVNDLFGNMPVRVKSRALAFQKSEELQREWESLGALLVSISLANDQIAKLILSDFDGRKRLAIRMPVDSALSNNHTFRQQDELDLKRVSSILVQAGFITPHDLDSWRTASARLPDLRIQAAISLNASPTKQTQFVSIAGHPLISRTGTNIIYEEMNRLFALSDWGQASPQTAVSPPFSAVNDFHRPGSKSAAKGVRRWPMFYIRIVSKAGSVLCNDSADIAPECDSSVKRILDVLSAIMFEFLSQYGFRPLRSSRKRHYVDAVADGEEGYVKKQRLDGPRSLFMPNRESTKAASRTGMDLDMHLKWPAFGRSALASGQIFGNWSRVKYAKEETIVPKDRILQQRPDRTLDQRLPSNSFVRDYHEISEPVTFEYPETNSPNSKDVVADSSVEKSSEGQNLAHEFVPWTDSETGETFLVNLRTGHTKAIEHNVSVNSRQDMCECQSAGIASSSLKLNRLRRTKTPCTLDKNSWIENFLKKWSNPTFTRSERAMVSIDSAMSGMNCCDKASAFFGRTFDLGTLEGFQGRISKDSLLKARIIAQVDQKFILVALEAAPDDNGAEQNATTVLTLIDQHAADERCNVEELYGEMFLRQQPMEGEVAFEVQTTDVEPLDFEVSAIEVKLLKTYSGFFSSWGINYDIVNLSACGAGQVSVRTLPTLIAERCRLDPGLILDVLRREIWKREENRMGSAHSNHTRQHSMSPSSASEKNRPIPAWIQWMSDCPQGIVDLLNSRACRTSIMFNDKLTLDECQTLVGRVARCVFPFQCAHGRPSMVPVLGLRIEGIGEVVDAGQIPVSVQKEDVSEGSLSGLDFLAAYKAWMND